MAIELATKNDLEEMKESILSAISGKAGKEWPARMKKQMAARYMNTSDTKIDEWVKAGLLHPQYDRDPELVRSTPAYFNREELDKIRFGTSPVLAG